MNGVSLKTGLVGFGLALLTMGACSAESSTPAPGGPKANNNGSGGSPGAGGSGTGILPGPTVTGGTTSTSTAGSVGTAGSGVVGTAGTNTGTGGGGALSACPAPPAAGTITDLLIDDLEDSDNGVAKIGGRSGYWYTYLDKSGSSIVPLPDPAGLNPLIPGATDCHGGAACVIVSGTTVAQDDIAKIYPFAGVGFDFSNAMKPCVYDATAYTGIKFWARGDVAVTIKVNTIATADAVGGGSCAANCSDGFGPAAGAVALTPAWQQIDLPFASMKQAGWGTPATLDKKALLSVQIQAPAGGAFNIAVDDFTFY